MKGKVVVLGAGGRFGRAAVLAFAEAGWDVRAATRSGRNDFDAGVDAVAVDGTDAASVRRAAEGCDVIVNALNPPYPEWAEVVPRFTAAVLAAAKATGATVLIPGNVYNFGTDYFGGAAEHRVAPFVSMAYTPTGQGYALLDAQDQAISRARDRAANLAHGLKTPLSALAGDIERLNAKGETEIADDISELAQRMRRHVQRELARARLRHGRSHDKTPLKPIADGVLRALKRTPDGEELELECAVAPSLTVPVDPDDLNELIGNLAENAVRFARSRVRVDAERNPDATVIRIGDDGPGLDPAGIASALRSDQRLDQSERGAGLGLAISGDIVESFGGQLELGSSPLGGLEARISIPLTAQPGQPPRSGT